MKKINPEEIEEQLNILYPNAHCELVHHNSFELLIAVILSAQSTDERVNMCTPSLFERYPDACALSKASYEEVVPYIKSIGLYHNKALNIIGASRIINEVYQNEVPSDRKSLESLPGVGRKTANVVLSNCFNVPAFAVDTHVSRVSKRLGIAKEKDDVLAIEKKLNKAFDKEHWCRLHHQFIFFGRYMCLARNPKCDECPFKGRCNHKKGS